MAKKQKPNPNQGQNRDSLKAGGQDSSGEQPDRQQHAETFVQGRERASDLRPSQQGSENFLEGREQASDSDRGGQR